MRFVTAHGSSKPRGRCGWACWHPARAGLKLAPTGGVDQAGLVPVRFAASVLVNEVVDGDRPPDHAQPPAFPFLWGLGWLVGGEQGVPGRVDSAPPAW